MSTITTKDGTEIYYKDWGEGPVVTLSHGWPLSSDAWDGQMLFLAQHGYRVVAHDRRGHGSSPMFVVDHGKLEWDEWRPGVRSRAMATATNAAKQSKIGRTP
jgi:pimeloyl-ACP methyl ester carboxylesterase